MGKDGYNWLTSLQVIAVERELLRREGKYPPSTTEEQGRKLDKEEERNEDGEEV